MNLRILPIVFTLFVVGCVGDIQEEKEPIAKSSRAEHKKGKKAPLPPVNPEVAPVMVPTPPVTAPIAVNSEPASETCKEAKGQHGAPPIWLAESGIVVTRIGKACVTSAGREGFEEDSPWMAMGIPCTGDGGKIDFKGELYAPKLISLILSTDCAMNPSDLSVVKAAGAAALGFSPSAKLLAYNPIAIQYWEIPGLGDADVGFTIDLRTTEAIQRIWKGFTEQQSIPVRLYGRENAWVMGEQFFFIQGELIKTGSLTFRLKVKELKALKAEEIAQVKANCEALRPARNCFKVFK